ncbi:hypothetical protein BOTCAL_0019g00430 [Botryotinia calthae]|uniref:BTB domain-containing protein n=1 Tax=Botryotinia calthae TaxID=38488 RepID=A0A4Y8DFD4_9HELO|nr:hypothetical protein BOTCAL_0019g00430 [Botryotinia calthae]
MEYVEWKRKRPGTKREFKMRANGVIDGENGMVLLEGRAPFDVANTMPPLEKRRDPKGKHATVESPKNIRKKGRQYWGDSQQGDKKPSLIRLKVGNVPHNRHTFHVSKAILRAKVKYFDNILTQRPTLKNLNLHGKEPTSFALFLNWICYGRYAPLNIEEGLVPFRSRIILYDLGDEYKLPELMDYTMTVLITNYAMHDKLTLDEEYAHLIYLDTVDGSKLRSFVSHSLAMSLLAIGNFSEKQVWMMEYGHPDLWRDVSSWMGIIKVRSFGTPFVSSSFPGPWAPSKCVFHVHNVGAACSFMGDIF